MSGPAPGQKKLTIRVRIPQSAMSPEEFQAHQAARPWRSGRRALGGGLVLLAAFVFWLLRDHPVEPASVAAVPEAPVAGVSISSSPSPADTTPESAPDALARIEPESAILPAEAPPATPVENEVVRALITESMRGGAPGHPLGSELATNGVTRRVHFYTELKQSVGKRYVHVWEYNGKTIARIDFKSRGNTWRASSNKKLPAHMQGEWRAKLLDEHGNELVSVPLAYGASGKLAATP
jgi:hypothetical protein